MNKMASKACGTSTVQVTILLMVTVNTSCLFTILSGNVVLVHCLYAQVAVWPLACRCPRVIGAHRVKFFYGSWATHRGDGIRVNPIVRWLARLQNRFAGVLPSQRTGLRILELLYACLEQFAAVLTSTVLILFRWAVQLGSARIRTRHGHLV